MKTLIIIRHAKAEQTFSSNDFERSLNERGKADAPEMAKRLRKKLDIDTFIASPAKRTKKTAQYFCKAFDKKEEELALITALYQAPTHTFVDLVSGLDENDSAVAIVAHNPGVTNYVNELVPDAGIENMPTCAVCAIKADVETWSEFQNAKKQLLFFDYPKNS